MKIEYIHGDILASKERVIIHGCNAQGVMGAGIAKAIKEKYPKAFQRYRDEHGTIGLKVGDCIPCFDYLPNRIILNAITQEHYGSPRGYPYVSYEALAKIFKLIDSSKGEETQDGARIAMPKIGAGLAGGDWEVIEKIIEESFVRLQPVVYIWP